MDLQEMQLGPIAVTLTDGSRFLSIFRSHLRLSRSASNPLWIGLLSFSLVLQHCKVPMLLF